MKTCRDCCKELPDSSFRERKKHKKGKTYLYLNVICRACEKIERKRNRDSEYRIDYKARKREQDPVKFHMQERIATWRRKDKNNDLTVEGLTSLWEKQQGFCYYTGEPMVLTGTSDTLWENASLDRLNPDEGYVLSNVVWATYRANSMKGDTDFTTFLKRIHAISERHCGKSVI